MVETGKAVAETVVVAMVVVAREEAKEEVAMEVEARAAGMVVAMASVGREFKEWCIPARSD